MLFADLSVPGACDSCRAHECFFLAFRVDRSVLEGERALL